MDQCDWRQRNNPAVKLSDRIPTWADTGGGRFPTDPVTNGGLGHSVRREVKPVKKYELIFILQADQAESEMESRVQRVKDILADHEGEITQENHWGVRRLAYEIEHENKGNYMFLKFRSHGTAVEALDKFLRLDDKVLRHLVVVDDEWEDRNRKARAKRNSKSVAEAPAAAR